MSYDADRIHEFLNVVHHTPESTHYVVNEELYHRLQDSGELTLLEHDGINVIDGSFSHTDAVNRGHDVLEAIGTHHDVHDHVLQHVPVVTGVIALASIGVNTYKYVNGASSGHELAADIAGTFTRIAAGSGGMAAGSAAGAAI